MIRGVKAEHVSWILQHAVDVAAPRPFVWAWRSDISTWHDPPARFELDGPFGSGSQGRTIMPGQPELRWMLTDVCMSESFAIELTLEGAAAIFEWRFESIDDGHTRMTQRIGVTGENAPAYVEQIQAGFGATLAEGMAHIAATIEQAARAGEQRPEAD
jgi:hypothetical protein